jgi:hypothetical protein
LVVVELIIKKGKGKGRERKGKGRRKEGEGKEKGKGKKEGEKDRPPKTSKLLNRPRIGSETIASTVASLLEALVIISTLMGLSSHIQFAKMFASSCTPLHDFVHHIFGIVDTSC